MFLATVSSLLGSLNPLNIDDVRLTANGTQSTANPRSVKNYWKNNKGLSRKVSSSSSPLNKFTTSTAAELASWTDLTTNCTSHLPQYTLAQVAEHCTHHDCWIVLFDKVYDVTNFMHEHPGGDYIIGENAGRDATIAFRTTRHGKDAFDLMDKYCIGILVEQERLYNSPEGDDFRGP